MIQWLDPKSHLLKESPVVVRLHWSETSSALKLIKGMLKSKPLIGRHSSSGVGLDLLGTIFLQAFLSSLHEMHPNVRFVTIVGSSLSSSELFKSSILLDLPMISPGLKTAKSQDTTAVAVVLFDTSLEIPPPETGISVVHRDGPVVAGVDLEMPALARLLAFFLSAKVGLVASQKLVHPWLRRQLELAGVFVVSRLSALHMNAVQSLTGATIISNPISHGGAGHDAIPLSAFGATSIPRKIVRSGKLYVVLGAPQNDQDIVQLTRRLASTKTSLLDVTARNLLASELCDGIRSRRVPVATLVLTGPDRHVAAEVKAVLEGAVSVLAKALKEPFLLRGAGTWERAAAAEVRRRATKYRESQSRGGTCDEMRCFLSGVDIFADCLESACVNISETREAAFDSFSAALQALESSVEVANCILRIKTVVNQSNKNGDVL